MDFWLSSSSSCYFLFSTVLQSNVAVLLCLILLRFHSTIDVISVSKRSAELIKCQTLSVKMPGVPVGTINSSSSVFLCSLFLSVVGCSLLPARQLCLLQVGELQSSARRARPGVEARGVLLHPLWTAGSCVHR